MWETQTSRYTIQSVTSHKVLHKHIHQLGPYLSMDDSARQIQGIWNLLNRNDRKLSLNSKNTIVFVCPKLATGGLGTDQTKLSRHLQLEKKMTEKKRTCLRYTLKNSWKTPNFSQCVTKRFQFSSYSYNEKSGEQREAKLFLSLSRI